MQTYKINLNLHNKKRDFKIENYMFCNMKLT